MPDFQERELKIAAREVFYLPLIEGREASIGFAISLGAGGNRMRILYDRAIDRLGVFKGERLISDASELMREVRAFCLHEKYPDSVIRDWLNDIIDGLSRRIKRGNEAAGKAEGFMNEVAGMLNLRFFVQVTSLSRGRFTSMKIA